MLIFTKLLQVRDTSESKRIVLERTIMTITNLNLGTAKHGVRL